MKLRQGKTKSILQSSINSALLAVEIYNKPRSTFRSECYITLMAMAWMRLFHAYFHRVKGDKYYYKKDGQWEIIDGERKTWELGTCITKHGKLSPSVVANLEFFIGLRNKIEHRHIDAKEVDTLIFGECQALLYNYESTLVEWFGADYGLNENLAYSLQFSKMRVEEQKKANKALATQELQDVKKYIEDYRSALKGDVFDSQEYSIKLLQIPKVSNTNRNDLAVEFVKWSELSEEDKENYEKLLAIVKDKIIVQEAVNTDRYKPGDVLKKLEKRAGLELSQYDHRCLYYIFSLRPISSENLPPETTNTKYCLYDATHEDYVYTQKWIDFVHNLLTVKGFTLEQAATNCKAHTKLDITAFE